MGFRVLVALTALGGFLCAPAPARADPTWVALTQAPASGQSLHLLRRGGVPTFALCVRSEHPPTLRKGASEAFRARGGGHVLRQRGGRWELCLRAPARESALALWALAPGGEREVPVAAPARGAPSRSPAGVESAAAQPAAIAMVGDIDADAMVTALRKIAVETRAAAPATASGRAPGAQPEAWLSWRTSVRGTRERASAEIALEVLRARLAGSRSAPCRVEGGLHSVSLGCAGSPVEFEQDVSRELGRMARFRAAELSRAKRLQHSRVLLEIDGNLGVARALLDGVQTLSRPRATLEHLRFLSSASLEQVRAGAALLAKNRVRWQEVNDG